jgi:intron-binding protein aquarius
LTVVVGPPGTGKTDVAVQIVHNLYHNFKDEKILVLAHSNAALDDIFGKIKMVFRRYTS